MKFNFKIQPFQTEAVDSVIRVFFGQPGQERVSCRRDIGKNADSTGQFLIQFDDATGYRNAEVGLSDGASLSRPFQVSPFVRA